MQAKREKPRTIVYSRPFNVGRSTQVRWVENVSRGLRRVGFADEIARSEHSRSIEHNGWYLDREFPESSEVFRGVVYRLPHGRFAYGYVDPWNDDRAVLCFDNDADSELDAARLADRIAEVCAETESEYRSKCNAARHCESIREDLAEQRKRHSMLCAASAHGIGDDATGARMRAEIRGRVHKLVKEHRDTVDTHGAEILTAEFN